MHPWLKTTTLSLVRGSGLLRIARARHRRKLRILTYHGVDDHIHPRINQDGFFVPPDTFRAHMRVLQKFRVIALDEAVACGQWPEHAVAITFDDGYANNLEVAAPILREFGFPATFFLTTDYIAGTAYPWWFRLRAAHAEGRLPGEPGPWEQRLKTLSPEEREATLQQTIGSHTKSSTEPRMLTWQQARELHKTGFSVGGHTTRHTAFAHASDATIASEISESLGALREHGIPPSCWFAYPYGTSRHIRSVPALFQAAGIRAALTEEPGMNPPHTDPYTMKRLSITAHHHPSTLEALLSIRA